MTKLSTTDYVSQSDTAFADNSDEGIEESDFRTQFEDTSDSFVHLDESKYQRQAGNAAGSANAITLSVDYPAAYTANIPIRFTATATNTGAVTINLNSLGALNIYDLNQAQVTTAGAITSGLIFEVEWSTDADGAGTDGFVLTKSGATTAAAGAFDTITDQAGTGPPDFSQGLTLSGGSDALTDYVAPTSFSVTCYDANSGGNSQAQTGSAYYVRIGNVVYFQMKVENVDLTGLTGANTLFVGLPIAASNSWMDFYIFNCEMNTVGYDSGATHIVPSVGKNLDRLRFVETGNNFAVSELRVNQFQNGVDDMRIGGFYFVD